MDNFKIISIHNEISKLKKELEFEINKLLVNKLENTIDSEVRSFDAIHIFLLDNLELLNYIESSNEFDEFFSNFVKENSIN